MAVVVQVSGVDGGGAGGSSDIVVFGEFGSVSDGSCDGGCGI